MDVLAALAYYLKQRKFSVTKHEPDSIFAYPSLVVKQKGRDGYVRVWLKKKLELTYSTNGHRRRHLEVELEDPESIQTTQRFLRTAFRELGKRK